ncbi:MAG: glycosyltransferase, partial [Thermoguttaceae bacterium]|nr:glycosyltransferase [Thermoguttaceae bacterium]
ETRQVVEALKSISPVPILHVWQPDEGFQLAKIRNRGIAAAHSDYIICVDGDLILGPHFVEDHIFYAESSCCVFGKRVKLKPKYSAWVQNNSEFSISWFWSPKIKLGYHFYSLRNRWLCNRTVVKISDFRFRPHILGCNMAFWKSDAIRVNGFDEEFTVWGLEDRDFSLRLRHAGVALKCIRFSANLYHLYHVPRSKDAPGNMRQFMKCAAEQRIWAEKGLDQYVN